MPQKLAIAISGAVSLGSYEAGVLYEILQAIEQHNNHPGTNKEDQIKIDVITGASAGAMTACILAQKLLFDTDSLRNPYDNVLYQAWVEKVGIENLLQLQESDNPNHSIFASSLIAKIGKELLLARYQENYPQQVTQHSAAADSIRIGLSLSNLNGFDFALEVTDYTQLNQPNPNSFVFTRHQDKFITEIKASDNQAQVWEEIEKIGRSSGAFPFAFQVLGVRRTDTDEVYKDAVKSTILEEFAYTDGGIFENEPLIMAKYLVNQISTQPSNHENRFYLYIAPGPKKSSANQDFKATEANFLNTFLALGKAVFTQARFHELIETNQINSKLREFEAQALGLKNILTQSSNNVSNCFDEVATKLLDELYREDQNTPGLDDTTSSSRGQNQQADFDRLKDKFDQEYKAICNSQNKQLKDKFDQEYETAKNKKLADIWIKTVQVLEKSAGLGQSDVMKIYAITSEDKDLIGEGLSAFVGFMKKEFRQFDYNVGRINAINSLEALQKIHKSGKVRGEIYLQDFKLPNKPSLDPELVKIAKSSDSNEALYNVDPQIRKNIKKVFLDRSEKFMAQWLTKNPVLLWMLKKMTRLLLSHYVDRLLKLKKQSYSSLISNFFKGSIRFFLKK